MSTSTRLGSVALVGALALAGSLAIPVAAFAAEGPPVATDPVRLDTGHIDAFNLVLGENDSVRLVLKEDVTEQGTLRTPESVDLFVKSQSIATNLPAGALPGDAPATLYYLPLTQDPDLIWPGWDTQEIGSVYGRQADVDINVTDVTGPGQVYLWSQGVFGDAKQLLTDSWKFPGTIHQTELAHAHANWGFTQPGQYTLRAQATVTSADGTKTATSNAATYTFTVAPRPTAVVITGAESQVAPGAQLTLSAAQSPAGATFANYSWSTRASASAEWAPIDGQTESTLTVSAVDGAQYKAAVTGGYDYAGAADGIVVPIVVESTPVTIAAPAVPVPQTIAIAPLAAHYHSGTPIDLAITAEPASPNGSYHWYLQRRDQNTPVQIDGVTIASHRLTAEQALDGAVVTAALLDENGAVVAQASPVTVHVDDHDAAPVQKVTIQGVASHYHEGDTVSLTASVAPASVLTRFEWYVQKSGETAPVRVAGQNGSAYSFTASDALDGAAVIAKLTYDDGTAYVESAPAIIQLEDHGEVPDTVKPNEAPAAQTAASLDGVAAGGIQASDSSPAPSQVITVQIGDGNQHAGQWVAAWLFSTPTLLNNDWTQVSAQGTIAVTIPAGTPVGAHRLAVFDADGALVGWQAVQVTSPAAAVADPSPASLASTGAEIGGPVTVATILLLLGLAAMAARQVRRRSAPDGE